MKEFSTYRKEQRFCSVTCNSHYGWSLPTTHKRELIKKPCKQCGQILETTIFRIEDGRGKYCSKKCYSLAMSTIKKGHKLSLETRKKLSEQRIGKLNPAYKHGQSNSAKKYQGTFPRYLKEQVLKRDNFTCIHCTDTKNLVVHHIDHDPLNNDIDNLETHCRSCHTSYHRTYEYENKLR